MTPPTLFLIIISKNNTFAQNITQELNYIQVENISKSFGFTTLFSDVSFGIFKGDKVALIAKNGTGKSTILNIIAKKTSPDTGSVSMRNGLKVNYLEQAQNFNQDLSITENLYLTKNEQTLALKNYKSALKAYNLDANAENTENLQHATNKMDAVGAWEYEIQLTTRLGEFGIYDLDQKMKELSGGQQKKVSVALATIGNPDFLLLDEPTNHLDFEMIEWLEDYLNRSTLSLLVVTHDRYFLNNVCNTIFEIDNNQLYTYKGNYSYYLEKKAEREANDQIAYEKSLSMYKSELEWIRKMPKARGTKSKSRIDSFAQLEDKISYKKTDNELIIESTQQYLGKKILEINNVSKSFDNKLIINDFSYIFKRNEKIGVIGLNGCGKSTLLNIIAGKIKPDKGNITVGQTVVMGYYTQSFLEADKNLKVEDIVKSVAEEIKINDRTFSASQFLYRFNFSYAMQQAFYSNLSGGEKRRLNLLLQIIKNPNFLMLDEPTNDLDIYTLQILEDYLINFKGCLLIVSHDRFMLDRVCDHIFVFSENGNIKDHYGNYTQYYIAKTKEEKRQRRLSSETENKKTEATVSTPKVRKPTYKQLKRLEELEELLHKLETDKDEITNKLSSGNLSNEEIIEFSKQFEETENQLNEAYNEWIELSDEIQKLEIRS
ncbi:MAG: ABC-F family ATP-binding cassette domain-containing protein [Lentimicrobiaceae bacterium]|nr:ABC-F family ATP-binding cassette domain-containing protein [Lentimicrobiaceae bacterium]